MRTLVDPIEKRRLFNERWPEALARIDRAKFQNRRAYKAKVGWARRALWAKIIKELLNQGASGVSI